jgi:hypothetical protein
MNNVVVPVATGTVKSSQYKWSRTKLCRALTSISVPWLFT